MTDGMFDWTFDWPSNSGGGGAESKKNSLCQKNKEQENNDPLDSSPKMASETLDLTGQNTKHDNYNCEYRWPKKVVSKPYNYPPNRPGIPEPKSECRKQHFRIHLISSG